MAAASQTVANRWTRSPDETTSTPNWRTQFDGACVDTREYGIAHERRVLHRDAPHAAEQLAQSGFELIAAGVARLRTRQMVERIALDGMDEAARFAGRRDEVVPAPRREVPAVAVDAGHFAGDGIQPVEIVQQPAVEAVGRERRLNGR